MDPTSSRIRYDVAILTVIGVEFAAVQRALKIDVRQRKRVDGAIYYETTVYSKLLQADLKVIVGCIVDASQANASAMATKMILAFDPALIVLLGIGAGMRGKLKIGDVVVPREVADLSVNVIKPDGPHPRPQIKPWPFAVKQMMPGFILDEAAFHSRCREIFGPAIIPTTDKEAEFATHVTFKPRVADNAIGSSDNLLRSPDAFVPMILSHEGIRTAEMEAGGFIKACESNLYTRPWLVIRGISDFGDDFKDDNFHRLASSGAAAWLTCFLEDGFDLLNLRPGEGESLRGAEQIGALTPATELAQPAMSAMLSPLAANFISGQIERLAQSSTADRLRDFEEMREAWRVGRGQAVLERIRAMKSREDWPLINAQVRGKFLRFEASVGLALSKDVAQAKKLAAEARAADPEANTETLHGLIDYHERGPLAALANISAPTTQDAWNLRIALLAETNNWKEVLAEFEKPPSGLQPDCESRRLRALALLFSDNVADARAEIMRALTEHPQWFNLRFTGAVIDYFGSLSPALLARTPKNWPAPTDPSLVRRDDTALSSLRRAGSTLDELIASQGLDREMRRDLEGWRLACLANDIERQSEAQSYCATLLERDSTHPMALTWATARGYVDNLEKSIDGLFAELFPES